MVPTYSHGFRFEGGKIKTKMDFRLVLPKVLKSKGATHNKIVCNNKIVCSSTANIPHWKFTSAETPLDCEMPKDDALGLAFVQCDLENDYFCLAFTIQHLYAMQLQSSDYNIMMHFVYYILY